MCEKCGCSDRADLAGTSAPSHDSGIGREKLSHLDRLAERNRGFFLAKRVLAVNVLSFSGSSVRPLIQQTLASWGPRRHVVRVDGAFLDSIHAAHDHPHEHNSGHHSAHGHHPPEPVDDGGEDSGFLDAHKISHALRAMDWDRVDAVLLENGGSAACQAVNDLGETLRVAVFSAQAGEQKPLKFPLFFQHADAVVIQNSDPVGGFDRHKALANVRQVAPQARVLEISIQTGAGFDEWIAFLEAGVNRVKA